MFKRMVFELNFPETIIIKNLFSPIVCSLTVNEQDDSIRPFQFKSNPLEPAHVVST